MKPCVVFENIWRPLPQLLTNFASLNWYKELNNKQRNKWRISMISNDSPLELIALHGSLTVEYIIELMSIIFSNDCIQLTYGLAHHIPKQTRSWITSSCGNSLLDRDPNPETFSARLFLKKREKLPLCKNVNFNKVMQSIYWYRFCCNDRKIYS